MNNKPEICPYCNEELGIEKEYSLEIIDKDKSGFDLKNTKYMCFYNCKNCNFTVGEIKQDKIEWVLKEEALKRKKIIYETVYKKYELDEKLKKIIPKWFDDIRNEK